MASQNFLPGECLLLQNFLCSFMLLAVIFEHILCVSDSTSKNLLTEIFKVMSKELATTNLTRHITQ